MRTEQCIHHVHVQSDQGKRVDGNNPPKTQKDDSKLLCCPKQGISLVKVPSMFRRGRVPAITGEIATPMELEIQLGHEPRVLC